MRLVIVGICALAVAAMSSASMVADPKELVLQLRDLPAGFERTSGRQVSNAQAARETSVKKDYGKLGRITGYEAVFTKDGLAGILQVTSVASTYRTAGGAHESWVISRQAAEANRPVRFRRLSIGARLGHEAWFFKATMTNDGVKVDVFTLGWRSGRTYAGVLAGAVSGTADPAAVVALARKQQVRIAKSR